MKNTVVLRAGARLIVLAAALSSLCLAQPIAGPRSRVFVTHVKPDMLYEWLDLQKNELNPALKKAGVRSRTVYETVFGTNYEYISISPLDKYADLDSGGPVKALGPQAAARLFEKLRKCTNGGYSYVSTRIADLSNAPEGDPPSIVVLARVRIAPGKRQEWENLEKTEVLPVYKKGNRPMLVVSRGFGPATGTVTIVNFASNFAELDQGSYLSRTLGAEATTKLFAKLNSVSTLIEVTVRRRVPDLSF